jgi:hypothetical protein
MRELLMARGVEPDAETLQAALISGDLNASQAFLNAGVVFPQDLKDRSLCVVAGKREPDARQMAEFLLAQGARLNDNSLGSPLKSAAMLGNPTMFRFFLEQGADLSAIDEGAIRRSVQNSSWEHNPHHKPGHVEIIRAIGEAGVSFDSVSPEWREHVERLLAGGEENAIVATKAKMAAAGMAN